MVTLFASRTKTLSAFFRCKCRSFCNSRIRPGKMLYIDWIFPRSFSATRSVAPCGLPRGRPQFTAKLIIVTPAS
jgi:hypothetical protein